MSCYICARGSCSTWFHSLEEQDRFAPAIALFNKAEELRLILRQQLDDEEAAQKEEEESCP